MRQSKVLVYVATTKYIDMIRNLENAYATKKTFTSSLEMAKIVSSANHPVNGLTSIANPAKVPNYGLARSAAAQAP